MKLLKNIPKRWLIIIGLATLNLLILGAVFQLHVSSKGQLALFSYSSENQADLMKKINEECQTQIKEVIDGVRRSFICSVTLKQKHKGVSFGFKSQFKIVKAGDSIKITQISGDFRNEREHITEANFCNNCFEDRSFSDSAVTDIGELMKEVEKVAEAVYEKAQDSVERAYEEQTERTAEIREGKNRARNCEGTWNTKREIFEEFEEASERLECRLGQMHRLDNPWDVERFYHTKFKKEMWRLGLSGDYEDVLDDEFFQTFRNPARYALSVQSSTGLLQNYLRWKEDFDLADSLDEQEKFLRNLTSDITFKASLMTKDQARQDLYYLNKGFDGMLSRIDNSFLQQNLQRPRISNINTPINFDQLDHYYH